MCQILSVSYLIMSHMEFICRHMAVNDRITMAERGLQSLIALFILVIHTTDQ